MRKLLAMFFLCPLVAWAEPSLLAPLFLEGRQIGEVWVDTTDPLTVDRNSFEKAMEAILLPAALQEVKKLPDRVPLAQLDSRGIQLVFDPSALVLRAKINSEQRIRPEFRVRGLEQSQRDTIGPEPVSGYLNTSVNQGFSYPKSQARMPLRSQLDFVTNVRGFVFETGEVYQEKDAHPWRRQDTKITRDFEEYVLRTSVGDIYPFTTGYQSARSLGGVAASRQFSIQPYLNTRPQNRTEIYLNRPSSIEIFVNDGFVQRIYANAGPLELRDFPLFSGVNKVDIKIIDDTGKIQWLNLNLLYDVQLLGKGVQQFAYQLGFPSEPVRADRRYRTDQLFVSGFHRIGWSDSFSAGWNYQSDPFSWLAGTDAAWMTRGGIFSGEYALSHYYSSVAASAAKLRYRTLDYKLGSDRPLRGVAEVEYKSRFFSPVGNYAQNLYSWRTDVSLAKAISPSSSAGIGVGWGKNRDFGPDRKWVRGDIQSEFAPQWRAGFSYTVEREAKLEHKIQFNLSWIDIAGRYFGNVSYDYPAKIERLEFSRNASSQLDDYRATVGLQNSPRIFRADALAEYTMEQAVLRLEHFSERAKNEKTTAHQSTISAASALVFAGANFGLSRPVADSFVLLKSNRNYADLDIPVNLRDQHPEARVNPSGVLPTLSAYTITPVVLDSTDFPVGYALEKDHFWLRPSYKSGIFLPVGGRSTVLVSGILKNENSPLGLKVGEVFQGSMRRGEFFTNRNGSFLLENLEPGDYELRLERYQSLKFSISEDAKGELTLPESQLEEIQ